MTSPLRNRPIGMDARMLVADGTGVATYARALRAAQLAIAPDAVLIAAAPGEGRMMRLAAAIAPIARRLRREPGRLASRDLFRVAHVHFGLYQRVLTLRAEGPPGLVHWSYPIPLRIAGWANLYTVHDAIPLTDPALTAIDPVRHARVLAAISARAARIVTVSQAARAAIVGAIGAAGPPVVDLSQPIDLPDDAGRAAIPAGLVDRGYLLVVGSVEPRKNIARILAGYRVSGVALPLVLAGPDGWRSETVAAAIAATPGVVRLRGLDRDGVLALIAHARALLMPGLAEGFGLPVAEAMTLGTPVLTANRGALAETAGGAAILVDPEDERAIADGIARLANDDALVADLVRAGRANAARFTPAVFAARLAALYDEVASAGGAAYPPTTS